MVDTTLRARKPVEKEASAQPEEAENNNFPEKTKPTFPLGKVEFLAVSFLVVLAIATRLLFLDFPNQIVFDEIHFAGFAAKYITGE